LRGQKYKTPSETNNWSKKGRSVARVVECLPNKCKVQYHIKVWWGKYRERAVDIQL
jgi:hypothetical protein